MNRREFLLNAATGLFIAATPKIIVDMGRFAATRTLDPIETTTIVTSPNNTDWKLGDLVKVEYGNLNTKYFCITAIHLEPSRIIVEADRCFETSF